MALANPPSTSNGIDGGDEEEHYSSSYDEPFAHALESLGEEEHSKSLPPVVCAMAPPTKVARVVWKPQDYEILCMFLEKRENFEMLHGSGGKTTIGGNHPTKKSAYSAAAALLLGMGIPGPLDGESFMKKYQRYQAMYKKARGMKNGTGSGLYEGEMLRGITLAQKIEKTCPFFARANAIYGERPNMTPPATIELGSGGGQKGPLDPNSESIIGLGSHEGQNVGVDLLHGEDEDSADGISIRDEEEEECEVLPHEMSRGSIFMEDDFIDSGVFDSQIPPRASSPTQLVNGNLDYSPTEILSESEPVVTSMEDMEPEWMGASPPKTKETSAKNRGATSRSTGMTPKRGNSGTRIPQVGSKRLQRTVVSSVPSAASKPSPKPNLVEMFGQKITQRAKDQAFALASKERWKRAELDDKKEARFEEAKRLRLERQSKAKIAKEGNKYNLLIELAKLGRPIEDIKAILAMSDTL